ncbi:interleukin-21 receptor [Corythoichthys intestinalis]|uniref:interleukin-21 receptor n=1 Tax=Corythoichthys intestinalis TaxID=161448 RepID=UPI0025A562B0|nr:interleukin-21 receptor [Corythoichthys intestinalis]
METLKVMLLALLTAYCEDITDTGPTYDCTTDFLLTVNCSWYATPSNGGPQVMKLSKRHTKKSSECAPSNAARSCSVTINSTSGDSCPFNDASKFQIWLCSERRGCEMLDDSYKPSEHIKPKAPCCLSVIRNASRQLFTWKNHYEKCHFTMLKNYLQYQLCFYKRQDNTECRYINADKTELTVDAAQLETDTEYISKVRSKPSGSFKGQWSDWSQEVHWRTALANDSRVEDFMSKHGKTVFLGSVVTGTFVLMLSCLLLKKWRQGDFIPTPAPYFQNLYAECHGDFKSWADTQANVTMKPKSDDMLQMDSHEYQSLALYENLPLHSVSLVGRNGSISEEGKVEGRLDGENPRYCNDYCTMSTLQKCTELTKRVL